MFDLSQREYKNEFAGKNEGCFKNVSTPFLDESLDLDCVTGGPDEPTGELSDDCSKIVMKCLYGARMARPDLLRACTALASNVSCWTKRDDAKLHRLMSYIYHTLHYRLVSWVGDSLKDWQLNVFCDSDYASDVKTWKSTT